jgi:hypothetical protein
VLFKAFERSVKKQVAARVIYAALVPISLIATISDLLIGIGSGAVALATFTRYKSICHLADRSLLESRTLLIGPYRNFMQMFALLQRGLVFPPLGTRNSDATGRNFATASILKSAAKLHQQPKKGLTRFLMRQVVSRALVPAAASLLTLGKWKTANQFSRLFWETTRVVGEVLSLPMFILNPSALADSDDSASSDHYYDDIAADPPNSKGDFLNSDDEFFKAATPSENGSVHYSENESVHYSENESVHYSDDENPY